MTEARLAPQTGTGLALSAGQTLTVVDPIGSQVSDFFAFSADDHREWLSSGRSIDYGNKVFFTTGNVRYSNRSAPMATIIGDTCGRRDFPAHPLQPADLRPALPRPEGCTASKLLPEPLRRAEPVLCGARPDLHDLQHLHGMYGPTQAP